ADSGMGQHDSHGLPERCHRPMVALGVSRYRARPHGIRLCPGRRQHRGTGRSGPTPRTVGLARLIMLLLRYIARRIIFVVPQLFGIVLVSFFLVKLIPGDPAVMMLGPTASAQSLEELRDRMGFSKPLLQQFTHYVADVARGDLGTSWQTTRPVTEDLFQRFPATLELITFGLLLAIAIGFPLGVAAARLKRGATRKVADYYGLLAGAMPDFCLALVMIYVFYTVLGWIPAPLGRIDMAVLPPATVTGSLVIDSLIAGDWEALLSALGHLALPVLTLGLINAG